MACCAVLSACSESRAATGTGEGDKRADTMIVTKEVGVKLAQLDGVGHTALAMALRRGLISHQVMGNPSISPS